MAQPRMSTLYVQVQPELPEDFSTQVDRAVSLAVAESHLGMASNLLLGFGGPLTDPEEHEKIEAALTSIFEILHPTTPKKEGTPS